MKKEFLSIIFIFLIGSVLAQTPESFKYQAVARDTEGNALTDTFIGVMVSIKAGSIDGNTIYSESFTALSNKVGIIGLNIGKGQVMSGDFSEIEWGSDHHFLNVAIDVDGGSNYMDMGTSQLLSVPYSLYTKSIFVHYSGDTLYIGDQYVIISGGGGSSGETVVDYDGYEYETVTIGTQTWLKENLRSVHYADGMPIEEVYVYEDNESNATDYGRLYTWAAVTKMDKSSRSVQGICPDGWHVPSKSECETLVSYLGGVVVAGGKMKEIGTTHWETPNDGATNESGFSGRGSGTRGQSGNFESMHQIGAFWTSDDDGNKGTRMALFHDIPNAFIGNFTKTIGYSARCIKD